MYSLEVILAGLETLNILRKQSIFVCLQADNDFYEGIRAGKNCSANFPLKFSLKILLTIRLKPSFL